LTVTGFPAQASVLSGQALTEQLLSKYSLSPPVRCVFYELGLNDTYRVETATDTFYLRAYRHGWRSQQAILAEIELLGYLREQGFPVAAPVRSCSGKFVYRFDAPEGVRYTVLFTEARGSPAPMNSKRSYLYGQLVARLHACTDQLPVSLARMHLDRQHLLDQPLLSIEPFLAGRRRDLDYLKTIAAELGRRVEELLPRSKPEYGICHGDHHGKNVHFSDSGAMTLFDFDCFGYGWRAYDIAVFLWSRVGFDDWSSRAKARRTRAWNSFLKGYQEVRRLTPDELVATRLFVPIRHIWLAGLHTQGARHWGRSWIQDSYFDEMLDFIKRWIETYRIA
jgi:Ser/Thr protein kinase RdoA (MazF antagonist)